jgi:hypothetical protein
MKNLFNWLILILLMTACNTPQSVDYSKEIAGIQKNTIPDKRLEYWHIDVKNDEGKPVLVGATVSEKAFEQLKKFAEEKSLEFKVQLYPVGDYKENQWGVVTLSVCSIRSYNDHPAELITQALMGTPVKVFTKDDGWYLIQTPDRYFGWVPCSSIALKNNEKMQTWKAKPKMLYKEQSGFAYNKPSDKSSIEFDLTLANLLTVIGEENGYYKTVLADGREGFVKKTECSSLNIWEKKSFSVDDVLETAYKFKGVPYMWGAASSKLSDCSGYVKTVYYYYGLILQRDASQQTLYGELVDTEKDYTKIQPGDLVFFGRKATADKKERVTHVGLAIGDQQFIHESGFIHINSLDKNSIIFSEHYEKGFVRARRVIGNIDGVGIQWIMDNEFYKQVLPE